MTTPDDDEPVFPPPGGDPRPTPRYGQYAPLPEQPAPPYGQQAPYGQQSPYGQQAPGPGAPYGASWSGPHATGQPYGAPLPAPPIGADRPGIIPLRPLTLGEVLEGAFGAIRSNPRLMLGFTALLMLVSTVLSTVGTLDVVALTTEGLDAAEAGGALEESAIDVSTMILLVVSSVVTLLSTVVAVGALTLSVAHSVRGRRLGVGEALSQLQGRFGRILGLSLTVSLLTLSPAVGLILLIGVLDFALAGSGTGVLALAVIVSAGAAIALIAWLYVRTLLMLPACVVEGLTVRQVLRRGWRLSRGSSWRLLGLSLLLWLLLSIVSSIVTTPVLFVAGVLAATSVPAILTGLLIGLGTLLGLVLQTSFISAATAVLYFDQRMRTEGLDVELAGGASGPVR